jgi:5-methylcytosine-specific restriction protein A
MMNWLISANSKIYDHASSFEHHGFIDWRENRTLYRIGDAIYIYCTAPIQRIRYRCTVEAIGIPFSGIRDDKEHWLDLADYESAKEGEYFRLRLLDQIDSDSLQLNRLQQNGLLAAPQGPKKLDGALLSYIESIFRYDSSDFFPEVLPDSSDLREGMRQTVTVNKYERSSIARALCIEHNRPVCSICGFDFEEKYAPPR